MIALRDLAELIGAPVELVAALPATGRDELEEAIMLKDKRVLRRRTGCPLV